MSHRLRITLALAVFLVLSSATPALAGCCAIVTLDALPAQIVAGQPVRISFIYRVNKFPRQAGKPEISATHARASESFIVIAEPQERTGHYAATLSFPIAGEWRWSIMHQPMPPLTVLAAPPSSANTGLPLAAGIVGLIGAAVALLVSLRTRARWAFALVVAGALIGVSGFAAAASGGDQTHRLAGYATPAEYGRALFMAKGCVVCHQHDAVREARKEFADFSVGPNLTHLELDPEYLRRWLKDPSAIRPDTFMPTLGLSDDEIEALIAFLKAE
ncbi:MAG TPA: c-type cytochrome [Anaerolineae bacterium]|nr:c-type cytochrome [Anaerolineae bacterium]